VYLERQTESFASLSTNMHIVCAYEELETPIAPFGMVVPEDSAVYRGSNVYKISVPADHSNMCKFLGSASEHDGDRVGYTRILEQIKKCVLHSDLPRLSSQSMTLGLDASRLPDTRMVVRERSASGKINSESIEPNNRRIVQKIQELVKSLKPNDDTTTIFIRAEGTKALLQFTNELLRKASEKASEGDTNLKAVFFPRFRGTVERVYDYIRNTSKQHRVLQFFTEDEIRIQLHEHHTRLGASYTSLTNENYFHDEQAMEAEGEDRTSIDEYMKIIGGDVTKIVRVLDCDNPPNEVMSTLKRLGVQVGRKDAGLTALLRDFIKWIDRDWFWLTFTSQSRQEIKAPLTRVVKDIIPFIEHAIANDDKIALTSNELTTFQMVDRLFAILDNSKNSALVKSLRSALAETSLRDRLRDADVDF